MDTKTWNETFDREADKQQAAFDVWMRQVNTACIALCGLHASDLPDYCYRDAFDDGATPKATAKRAIRAAKEDF